MEFLVEIETCMPDHLSGEEREQLTGQERERGLALLENGSILRIWRIPGQAANVGIWSAQDPSELHDLLTSLPLSRWQRVDVTALAQHPLESTVELPRFG